MNSFLYRNIASNLFYSNNRNSLNKKPSPSPITKYMNYLESRYSSHSKNKTIDSSIYYIFKIVYEREFPNILIEKSKAFLQNVNKKTEEMILNNLSNSNDYLQIKKFIGIGKDKVLNYYNEEYSFLNEFYMNYKKKPTKFSYFQDNNMKHCNQKNNNYIYHKCNSNSYGNFISINKKDNGLYIICIKCKKCYKNTYINLYCNICKKEYFGTIYKNIDPKKNNPDLYLATWKNYHCGIFNNEIMKCIKCKNYFYYNIKTNKLICQNKNCNFNAKPEYIIWKCSKCSKDFHSQVKPYNPIEFKAFKKAVYYIILSRNKARPLNIIRCTNCQKIINLHNITFLHSRECKGELYQGKLFNKEIIACSKCKYTSYLEEFIWTCPLCRKIINDNDNNNHKETYDINVQYNSHTISNSNSIESLNHRVFHSKGNSRSKINTMKDFFKKEKEKEKDIGKDNINRKNDNLIKINKSDYKRDNIFLYNNRTSKLIKVRPVNTYLNDNFKTIQNYNEQKTTNIPYRNLKIDTKVEKNISNYSLSKYTLNINTYNSNSNSTCLTYSKKSLQNKDTKSFNDVIMNNRLSNSKNLKQCFGRIREDTSHNNDDDQRKKNSIVKIERKNITLSNSMDLEKAIFKKRNRFVIRKEMNDNKDKNKRFDKHEIKKNNNSKDNNNYISVRRYITNSFGNNIKEMYNNKNTQTNMKEYSGVRSKYSINKDIDKDKDKEKNKESNNSIYCITDSNIYTKDKTSKIGAFYIKSKITTKKNVNINENTKDEDKSKVNNIETNKEKIKSNSYQKDDKFSSNTKLSLYRRYKNNNNINNEEKFTNTESRLRYFSKNISNNKNNNNSNSMNRKNRLMFSNTIDNKNDNEESKNDNTKSNKTDLNSIKNLKIGSFNLNSTKKSLINISPGPKETEKNNKEIESESINKDNEKKINMPEIKKNETVSHFRLVKKKNVNFFINDKEKGVNKDDNNNQNNNPSDNPSDKNEKDIKSKKSIKNKSTFSKSLSILVKKNLDEYFDNVNDQSDSNRSKGKNGFLLNKSIKHNHTNGFREIRYNKKKDNENSKDSENCEESENRDDNENNNNYIDDRTNYIDLIDYGEEKDEINDFNIKRVLEHFGRRTSVVKILRDIGNEDNNKKKNIENLKNDHLVLEGLINHVNLMSSPEKIEILQQHSTIPIFNDDDYCYCKNIGEGSNANIYLVKDNKTDKEYALKKMVCQEFNDLVKIKKKLEIINELNHNNIMKVIKIQFKCLDFTTYAINAVMEKAITDWNNEIKERAKNKNYYTEKELINIAAQIISGLAFLQENNIAHRDIKPQNILVFPNNVYKIGDLGEMTENIKDFDNQFTLRGSESFLSPALKNGLKHNEKGVKHNVFKSDVFSLGYCFLYAISLDMDILEQARKCWGKNKNDEKIKIDIKKYIGENELSNEFIDFIGAMILEDEDQRKDFLQLRKDLEVLF